MRPERASTCTATNRITGLLPRGVRVPLACLTVAGTAVAVSMGCAAPSARPATAPPSAPEAPPPSAPAEPVPGAGPTARPPVRPPGEPELAPEPAAAPTPSPARVVAEAWETERRPDESVDSVAVWPGLGDRPWLLATAEATDRLLVFDAESGEPLREFGSSGDGAGRFRSPEGIAVVDDLAFVVERDNARVQVLRLPGLSTAGFVGGGSLVRPYGITVFRRGDAYHLYVSDNPPPEDPGALTRRVHHYRVEVAAGTPAALHSDLLRTFGEADGPGALYEVVSLAADPFRGRLLVADETPERMGLRVYGLDGGFQGRVVGGFTSEPGGLALYACDDGGGYWIATDQADERAVFLVLNRGDLGELGRFTGRVTASTDGVWLNTAPTPTFPAGAVYAVHGDRSVTAFDWRSIAEALDLRSDCGAPPR